MTDKPKAPRRKRAIELTVQGDELVKKIEAQRSVRVVTLGKDWRQQVGAQAVATMRPTLAEAIDAAVAKVEAAEAAHRTEAVPYIKFGYTARAKSTLRQRFAKLLIAIADALYRAAGAK